MAAIGAVLLLSLGGCPRENQNAVAIFGPDSVVVVAPLATPAFLNAPGGTATATALELVSFDPAALDAFGRTNQPYQRNDWAFFRSSGYWRFGNFDGDGIGWGMKENDPRLPALTQTSAACGTAPCYDFDFMYFAQQGVFAGNGYDLYGEWCCATPNTNYVITLDRMQLTVNGELDATQVLLGQTVDQPDELSFLGGSPAGDAARVANTFDDANPYKAVKDANPFIIGSVPSCPLAQPYGVSCAALGVPDGYIIIDVVVDCHDAAGNVVWQCDGSGTDQSLSIVAPNLPQRFNFPNYNYMTIWNTNPDGSPDFSSPLVRYQLGVDLSALGGPINNAYAPFPRAPLSDQELALGTGAVVRPDSVTFALNNLKELAGTAAYQVWAVDTTGAAASLNFLYTAPGDTIATLETSFNGGPGTHTVTVAYPVGAADIVFSIESTAGAATPSNSQILWSPGLQPAGQAKTTSLPVLFGTFGEMRTWGIAGSGSGGLFGPEFREEYSTLPRPPVGYKYAAWLVSGDTLYQALPDTTFTTPPPSYIPLTDADVDLTISDVVQPTQILKAFTRICVTTGVSGCTPVTDYSQFDSFKLTLEPKAGVTDAPSETVVLEGLLPEPSAGLVTGQ